MSAFVSKYEIEDRVMNRIANTAAGLDSGVYTSEDAATAITEMAATLNDLKKRSEPHTYIPGAATGSITPCKICGNDRRYPKHQAA
jgi:hypothetical protein